MIATNVSRVFFLVLGMITYANAMMVKSAAPPAPSNTPPRQCPAEYSENKLCCNSLVPGSNPKVSLLFNLLKGPHAKPDLDYGLTCSPFAFSNRNCNVPVCCKDNNFNGIIAADCVPLQVTR